MNFPSIRLIRWLVLLAGVLVLVRQPGGSAEPLKDKDGKPKYTNKLAQESSPYLLQHAHNPVNWYPWGPEAFAKAKKENKLVFLSIGYSSCYWCHVMERQSFNNPEIAKLMNEWFVCIKVDREERPDIDNIYMTALYTIGGRGGWPLSMFLTAEGKPIVGGTYWPPEDKEVDGEKLRGFKSVLKVIHDIWTEKPKDILAQADNIAEQTATALSRARLVVVGGPTRDMVTGAVDALKEEFDPEYGGFGNKERKFRGTKFPIPPYLFLLHYEAQRTKEEPVAQMLALTLDKMALGGICDQLGGGFHRYSTERTWTVPHFEKMLYDNAQLAEIYALAYRTTKNPLYQRVLREMLAFVSREMTSPQGGFYSALDAETDAEEGRFYVWTAKEIDEALPSKEDAAFIRKLYGADGPLNFEEKYHIFVLPKPPGEIAKELKLTEEQLWAKLEPLRKKLFDVRSKRPRPFLDTKILTAWNGQMIAGFAVAGQALEEKAYLAAAEKAADFVLKNLRTKEGRLLRSYAARPGQPAEARLNAYLDDYAFFVHGLLCLHDATGNKKWLDEARTLTDLMILHHLDKEAGGYFYTSGDHEKLFARAKDQYDGAQPSGNSVAARNLVRLWLKTGDDQYRTQAERSFRAFGLTLKTNPTALCSLAEALGMYLDARAAQEKKDPPKEPAPPPKNRSDSVVKVAASAGKPDADGKQVVTITLIIDKDWHLYANPVGSKEFLGNEVVVTIGKVKPADVKVAYPKGAAKKEPMSGDTYYVYEDKVTIQATVQRGKGDAAPLEVQVRIIACSDVKKICLMPATVTRMVP